MQRKKEQGKKSGRTNRKQTKQKKKKKPQDQNAIKTNKIEKKPRPKCNHIIQSPVNQYLITLNVNELYTPINISVARID